jgi:pentatricopeptide repeat protein
MSLKLRMPERNLVSWNALIAGYGCHGMGDKAIEMFERLIAERTAPNHVTFLAVLKVYWPDREREEDFPVHDSKPRAMHCAFVIELFGREGLLDEAYSMVRKAPFPPTANIGGGGGAACSLLAGSIRTCMLLPDIYPDEQTI